MDIISFNEAATANGRIEKFIENPDSNSGVLTQPKVIEAGETVTIKSGRQAILADTVVDGDLVIEAGGEVFVPAGAGFGDLEEQIALKADIADVNTAGIKLKTIATGTATFTATTNNINLTGIGVGVEIGDVIQISGAEDAKNNSEFTVEVITNNNNIIVNQAHANKGTRKNVAARASDTGVTVKLLAKWYNAPLGLGQDWVDVTANRGGNVNYLNNTKRTIAAEFKGTGSTDANRVRIEISGISVESAVQGVTPSNVYANIPIDAMYKYNGPNGIHAFKELR